MRIISILTEYKNGNKQPFEKELNTNDNFCYDFFSILNNKFDFFEGRGEEFVTEIAKNKFRMECTSTRVLFITFCARLGYEKPLNIILETYDLKGKHAYADYPIIECVTSRRITKKAKVRMIDILLDNNCSINVEEQGLRELKIYYKKLF